MSRPKKKYRVVIEEIVEAIYVIEARDAHDAKRSAERVYLRSIELKPDPRLESFCVPEREVDAAVMEDA